MFIFLATPGLSTAANSAGKQTLTATNSAAACRRTGASQNSSPPTTAKGRTMEFSTLW